MPREHTGGDDRDPSPGYAEAKPRERRTESPLLERKTKQNKQNRSPVHQTSSAPTTTHDIQGSARIVTDEDERRAKIITVKRDASPKPVAVKNPAERPRYRMRHHEEKIDPDDPASESCSSACRPRNKHAAEHHGAASPIRTLRTKLITGVRHKTPDQAPEWYGQPRQPMSHRGSLAERRVVRPTVREATRGRGRGLCFLRRRNLASRVPRAAATAPSAVVAHLGPDDLVQLMREVQDEEALRGSPCRRHQRIRLTWVSSGETWRLSPSSSGSPHRRLRPLHAIPRKSAVES